MSTYKERLAKGSMYTFGATVALLIISIMRSSLIARLLGSENLGIFGIFNAIGTMIIPLMMMAIPTAIAKFIPEYKIKDKKALNGFVSIGLIFLIVTSLMGSIIIFFASDFIAMDLYQTPILSFLLKISAVFFVVSIMINYGVGILQGYEEIKKMSIINVLIGAISLPLIYIFGIEYGLTGIVVAGILANGVNIAIVWFVLISVFRKNEFRFSFRMDKSILIILLKLSIPLLLSIIIVRPAFLFGDSYLFLRIGAEELGYYRVAQTIFTLILYVPASISIPLLPLMSEVYASDYKKKAEIFSKILKLCLIAIIPLCAIALLWSREIISIIFGGEYLPAYLAMSILGITAFFSSVSAIIHTNMISMGKTSQMFWIDLYQAIAYVVVSILMINSFGLIGYVSGSVLVFSLTMIILVAYMYKTKRIDLKIITPTIIIGLMFVSLALLTTIFITETYFFAPFILFAVLVVVLYKLLTSKEKEMLKDVIRKIVPIRI
jgi:PST family polysaccharide transporter